MRKTRRFQVLSKAKSGLKTIIDKQTGIQYLFWNGVLTGSITPNEQKNAVAVGK